MNKCYSLPDVVHFLPDCKPSFLKPFSAGTENGLQLVLDRASRNILPTQGDETEDAAAPRQSSNEDQAARTAFSGPCGQLASKTTTTRSAGKYGHRWYSQVVWSALEPNKYQRVREKRGKKQWNCDGSASYVLLALLRLEPTEAPHL